MSERMCEEPVPEPPHYLHEWPCNNRAKWVVTGGTRHPGRAVCGVHARWYRKYASVGPLEASQPGDAS